MPILRILTNLPKNKIPKDFVDKIIPTLARAVNKPPEKFICVIASDAHIHMFGDSSSPGAVATLESIGNLGPDENVLIIKQLSEFVERELGVCRNRFLLTFYDMKDYNVAIAGTTAQHLQK